MKTIPLTQNKFALVDDQDYEALSQYSWYASVRGVKIYACRRAGGRKNRQQIYMHRQIIQPGPDQLVDHINGNGLDNQRVNLRLADVQQNNRNLLKRPGKTSAFKGVHRTIDGRWQATIKVNGKAQYLGRYPDQETAARAYDQAARQLFGEFARTNF